MQAQFFQPMNFDTAHSTLVPLPTLPKVLWCTVGDHRTISNQLGFKGPDIIYMSDHLFAGVIKCRNLYFVEDQEITEREEQETYSIEEDQHSN